jgi:stage V sporulation protein R
LTNFGNPIIRVTDGNHHNRGELYLVHDWNGADLQFEQAQLTLAGLQTLWGRPVHLETREEGRGRLLSFDGKEATSKEITPTTNAPALALGRGKPAAN